MDPKESLQKSHGYFSNKNAFFFSVKMLKINCFTRNSKLLISKNNFDQLLKMLLENGDADSVDPTVGPQACYLDIRFNLNLR